jgi:glyoxylase-like metal-dependent hydrolase (beta-lactamase superfamily II)
MSFTTRRQQVQQWSRYRRQFSIEEETKVTTLPNQSPTLTYDVFALKRPGLTRDVPPGTESLQWVANTATLIAGSQDAVLVDTFATIDHNRHLVEWVKQSGKNLATIYLTHAHGDHTFGIKIVLDHFPKARAVATPAVVQAMHAQIDPAYLKSFWETRFPGQIPEPLVVPEALGSDALEVERQKLVVIDDGFTDTDPSTSLYVPSIGLVVAGDAVYNGIHPYMAETSEQSRLNWIAALERIEALKPRAVVAGHKNPDNADSPQNIAATQHYIRDFNRLTHETTTARELYDQMLSLYPDRVNPGSLWASAKAAKAAEGERP